MFYRLVSDVFFKSNNENRHGLFVDVALASVSVENMREWAFVPALGEFVLILHGVLSVQVLGSLLFILGLLGLIKKFIVFLFNH